MVNRQQPFTFAISDKEPSSSIVPILVDTGRLNELRPDLAAALSDALTLHSTTIYGLYTGIDQNEENPTTSVTFVWEGAIALQVAMLVECIAMTLNEDELGDVQKNSFHLGFVQPAALPNNNLMERAWSMLNATLPGPYGVMDIGRGLKSSSQTFELSFDCQGTHYGDQAFDELEDAWNKRIVHETA